MIDSSPLCVKKMKYISYKLISKDPATEMFDAPFTVYFIIQPQMLLMRRVYESNNTNLLPVEDDIASIIKNYKMFLIAN